MKRKIGISTLIGGILVIIGLSIIGYAVTVRVAATNKQNDMLKKAERAIEEAYEKYNKQDPSANGNDASPDKQSPSQEINGAVGIMLIPKIDLKVAVGEGVDMETLKYAVGHFEGTALPGQKGNFAVAGHRSYTYSEYFNRLDELFNGDEIIVRTVKGEFKYKVYDKKVVEPTEVSVLEPTPDATLTLITCTPIRVATHRLIIKARLVQ